MPNFERNLRQTATYWAPLGLDAYGKRTFAAPVQRPCRWEDKAETFIDKHGKQETSRSKVFFSLDLELNGHIFLGTSAVVDPTTLSDAWEIRNVFRTPDLRNNKQLFVAVV